MAFGLDKPLLFVLIEADTPRLPNTAKKGYPLFALERVQREGLRTLVNFCSYLAADTRSTLRLYGAALTHWIICAIIVVVCYFVSIVWVKDVLKQPFGSREGDSYPTCHRGPASPLSQRTWCYSLFSMVHML
jgi:hypothetical protein